MNSKMSQQMTLLGLGAIVFYGVMFSSGTFSAEMMPQLMVSIVIFLCSGRVLRMAARSFGQSEDEEAGLLRQPQADWPWLTAFLNWTAAMLVIGIMVIILVKPAGISLREAISNTCTPEHFSAEFIP